MALMIFSFIVFLSIVTGFFVYSKPFKNYVRDHLQSILVNLIIVLLGSGLTIFGVVWGFRKESVRNFEDQLSSFNGAYIAVMAETSDTLGNAKKIKNDFDEKHLSVKRIYYDISEKVFRDPLFYKYSGNEYIFALIAYLEKARETNVFLDHISREFYKNNEISEKNIEKLHRKLDSLIYFTTLLQYQSQFYVYMYSPFKTIVPPNQEKVIEWIKNWKNHNVAEIEKELETLDKNKEGIRKGTLSVWKELREINKIK